jgi:two-component system chemotaxis response regulator CheB
MLHDGTAGLREIRARGGWTLVQTPDEAAFPSMPESAIANVAVDHVLPVGELADKVIELVSEGQQRGENGTPTPSFEVDPLAGELEGLEPSGMRTDITCPQCGGVLWEEVEDRITIYRCRGGHVYSPDSLLAGQGVGLDSAVWRSIRTLQERGALLRRLAARASSQGRERSAHYFDGEADEAMRRAAEMRRVLSDVPSPGPDGAERP